MSSKFATQNLQHLPKFRGSPLINNIYNPVYYFDCSIEGYKRENNFKCFATLCVYIMHKFRSTKVRVHRIFFLKSSTFHQMLHLLLHGNNDFAPTTLIKLVAFV